MIRRFFGTIFFILIIYFSWPYLDRLLLTTEFAPSYQEVKTKVELIVSTLDEADITEKITDIGGKLINAIDGEKNTLDKVEPIKEKSTEPDRDFSINGISLGSPKSIVELTYGTHKNSFANEFGSTWFVYHQNYKNFMMISYDDNKLVNAIYSNQAIISSNLGINESTSKEDIRSTLSNREEAIIKDSVYINIDNLFDLYDLKEKQLTLFFDEKKNDQISAILLIDTKLENNKTTIYAQASQETQDYFEEQMFEIINSTRAKFNLPILMKNEPLSVTAFKHSKDMAINNFFAHENLTGQSPFDRMAADNFDFTYAGENLAVGQFNSIYAHEALMNSQGHRDNILNKNFMQVGIGIDFNDENVPYYTMKFYTP